MLLSLVQRPIVMRGPTVCEIPIYSKFPRLGVTQGLYYYVHACYVHITCHMLSSALHVHA